MDFLFKKIYDVFQANTEIFAMQNLEPLKTIDRYRGQPMYPERFEYFETPALFIGFNIKWERGGKRYIGDGTLYAHVITDNPFNTGSVFPTDNAEALKKVFWYKTARKLLDSLESQNTGKLYRIDEKDIDTGVIVYNLLTYGFNYTDLDSTDANTIDINDATVAIVGKQLVKSLNVPG